MFTPNEIGALASGAAAFDYLDNTPFRMNIIILYELNKPFSRVWFHDLISHKGLCDLRCNRSVLMQLARHAIACVNTQKVHKPGKISRFLVLVLDGTSVAPA
jgi:hypothetical protein